jgi:penicillin amidase
VTQKPVIHRDTHGIPHVQAGDEAGLYWGMGRCHASDRGMQMLLMRILGQGRACEFLNGGDAMLEIDRFFRRMNWSAGAEAAAGQLPEHVRRLCEAYCEGVNSVFAERIPWELRLLGYRPGPWTMADSIALSRLTGYVGLAQSQARAEQILVEMVQGGVRRELLEELFPGILGGLDETLIRKVKLVERVIPESLEWGIALPRMTASNNWVVCGQRTASGKPILANDPHLEVNRLPAVWYEIALQSGRRYIMGATMPGLPAVIIGRTPDLAWGVTYAFLDAVDSWIEHCRDGKCLREGGHWAPFNERKEVIGRRGRPPVELTFYENEHGTLYGNPYEEGHYLATRWSAAESGCASVCGFAGLWNAGSIEEGMKLLGSVESAWCWVLADQQGNIGFQMSGLMPKRREGISGFVPLPGWEKENDWQGFVPPELLPRCLNPAAGYFITCNHNLNAFGQVAPINLCMASHRADRIEQLLNSAATRLSIDDMRAVQCDVYSLQAEAFMRLGPSLRSRFPRRVPLRAVLPRIALRGLRPQVPRMRCRRTPDPADQLLQRLFRKRRSHPPFRGLPLVQRREARGHLPPHPRWRPVHHSPPLARGPADDAEEHLLPGQTPPLSRL